MSVIELLATRDYKLTESLKTQIKNLPTGLQNKLKDQAWKMVVETQDELEEAELYCSDTSYFDWDSGRTTREFIPTPEYCELERKLEFYKAVDDYIDSLPY